MEEFLTILRKDLIDAGAWFGFYPDKVRAIREMVAEAREEDLLRLEILAHLKSWPSEVGQEFLRARKERFLKEGRDEYGQPLRLAPRGSRNPFKWIAWFLG